MLTISLLKSEPLHKTQLSTNQLSNFTLRWQDSQLLVLPLVKQTTHYYSVETTDTNFILECLKRSSVTTVCVDFNLGQEHLDFWQQICQQAHKKFTCLSPEGLKLPQTKKNSLMLCLKSFLRIEKKNPNLPESNQEEKTCYI